MGFPLETEQTALAILPLVKRHTKENVFGKRRKDFALVGFGYETILKGAETETHQLNNFLKRGGNSFSKYVYFWYGLSVWRFAFDTEQTPTEAWGELGKVGFIYQVFYLLFQVHVFMER